MKDRMIAGRTSTIRPNTHSSNPSGPPRSHLVRVSGASRLLESSLICNYWNPTKLRQWETVLYRTHICFRFVQCFMDSILTGAGRVLPKMEPVTPQTRSPSRKYPTNRDRLYTDHTLSICKTGVFHWAYTSAGSEELTFHGDIYWLIEIVTSGFKLLV